MGYFNVGGNNGPGGPIESLSWNKVLGKPPGLETVGADLEEVARQLADTATTPQAFGAVGDGIVDDTLALYNMVQYCNQFERVNVDFGRFTYKINKPVNDPKYPTGAGYVFTSKHVTLRGKNARLLIPDGANFQPFWFLGDSEAYYDEVTYMATTHYTNPMEYAEIDGIEFDFGTNSGGTGQEVAARFRYVKRAKFTNSRVINSNGNGVNFEHCENILFDSEIEKHSQYGVFVYMCRRGRVKGLIDGKNIGSRGVVIKQCYNGEIFSDVKVSVTIKGVKDYGISSGDTLESGQAVHVINHEKVRGVELIGCRIYVPSGGFTTAAVRLGQYTNGWKLSDIDFIATDQIAIKGSVLDVFGSTADSVQSESGDRLANHDIKNVRFIDINASSAAVMSVRATAFIKGVKYVNCKGSCLYYPATTYPNGTFSAPRMNVDDVEFIGCTVVDDARKALIHTTGLGMSMGKIKFTDTVMSAATSYLVFPVGVGLDIEINKMIVDGLTGNVTIAVFLYGSPGQKLRLSNLEAKKMTVASTSLQAIRSDAPSVSLSNITADFTGNTSTNRNILYGTANTTEVKDQGGHDVINSTAFFTLNADIAGQGINGRNRVYFKTTLPTIGSYIAGDIIFNPSAGKGGRIGWKRLTTGIGNVLNVDWQPFGAIDA